MLHLSQGSDSVGRQAPFPWFGVREKERRILAPRSLPDLTQQIALFLLEVPIPACLDLI
jgi:hypothetical protein